MLISSALKIFTWFLPPLDEAIHPICFFFCFFKCHVSRFFLIVWKCWNYSAGVNATSLVCQKVPSDILQVLTLWSNDNDGIPVIWKQMVCLFWIFMTIRNNFSSTSLCARRLPRCHCVHFNKRKRGECFFVSLKPSRAVAASAERTGSVWRCTWMSDNNMLSVTREPPRFL